MAARKVTLRIDSDLEKWLTLWAYLRESDLTSWMKIVLRLRVNATKEELLADLDSRAEEMGITRDDLINQILEETGFLKLTGQDED